jgi:DNA polymerase-1
MRSANQQCSTFIDVEPDENSFVHPRIGCSKAQTGRANSEDPNAQNIPKVLRDIYVPDTSEHVFIEIDWSQIEWRLQVVLSGDRTGLELLTSGLDNHKAVAAEILRKPYERVSKDERYRAKFVVHGLGYGRGARSIALQYGIPLDEVERFIKGFATRFTDFWTWRDTLVESVQRNAYLRNPFGRRRWWFSRQVTEIYNFNAQSTAADMMWVVLAMIDAQLPEGATVRLTVHDSFLICAHRDVAARAAECLKDIMEGTKWDMITDASARPDVVKKFYPEGWFCKADLALGRNWGECSKEGEIQAELFKLYEIGGSPK